MSVKPQQPKAQEPQPRPGVEVGDELYVHHDGQPCTCRVVAHGKHGVTGEIDGAHHPIKWQHVMGHKRRVAIKGAVVDRGEDGMLLQDDKGRRRYVAVPQEANEDPYVIAKSIDPRRPILLMKGGPIANRAGLSKKNITDKNGVQTTRWVSAGAGAPPLQPGQYGGWKNGEHAGWGKVHASGAHGITAHDSADGEHRVRHENVTHHWSGDEPPEVGPHEPIRKPVNPHDGDPDAFSAHDFASQFDDPDVTEDSIIEGAGPDARQKLDAARQRVSSVKQTIDEHAKDGKWNEGRRALHRKLIFEGVDINGKKVPGLLAPERVKAAAPPPGQKPTLIALGGRGGSGKSSLNGRVYDESRAIVLDADHIKGMLPEYSGWNAHQVHEESSEILEQVMTMARILGLNVVLDATMKTGPSLEKKIDSFKSSGFRVEAHYMHLPRQEAAKRAVGRFLGGGETGRYVPPGVVLSNTSNEKSFDSIKGKADAWSFHDNQGGKDEGPKLIAQKGEASMVAKKPLLKSDYPAILLVWKGERR